jgi:predicted Ser/Thr protein kinase
MIWEEGALRRPADSVAFGAMATVLPHQLRQVFHAEWEVPTEDLELGATIGEGEFGVVHRGRWHATPVAVKALKPDDSIRIEELMGEIATLMCAINMPTATCQQPPAA